MSRSCMHLAAGSCIYYTSLPIFICGAMLEAWQTFYTIFSASPNSRQPRNNQDSLTSRYATPSWTDQNYQNQTQYPEERRLSSRSSLMLQEKLQEIVKEKAEISTRWSLSVQRSAADKDTLILSGETVCAKLTGTFSADKLSGHEVDLKGVLTERTTSTSTCTKLR